MVHVVYMELEHHEVDTFLKRAPKYDLSYETMHHKKEGQVYDMAVAIPYGKKRLCWFTFEEEQYVALFFDMNRDHKLGRCTCLPHDNVPLALGTMVYGTFVQNQQTKHSYFVIEDIFHYSGMSMRNYQMRERWYLMASVAETCRSMFMKYGIHFFLPFAWQCGHEYTGQIPMDVKNVIGYTVHHIQYRAQTKRTPHLVVSVPKMVMPSKPKMQIQSMTYECQYAHDYTKRQYRYKTAFVVIADPTADNYHLYAYGDGGKREYFSSACVRDYETSVKINKIFRSIRENADLDAIEESDDEEDFQNVSATKYIDTHKSDVMLCEFSRKFRKWYVLGKATHDSRIAHIGQLVRNYRSHG